MKKLLLSTLSVVALSSASFAQVSITETDLSPVPTMAKIAIDTIDVFPSSTLTVGSTGSGQTWNFSTLVASDIDTVIYTNPAWTPYANVFPGSNYAVFNISNGDTTFVFTKKTTAKLEMVGVAIKDFTGNTNNYFFGNVNPPELLFNFPTSLNTAFTNHSVTVIRLSADEVGLGGQGFDSIRVTQTVDKYVIADATGTMTTPAFTAKPVLRVKQDKTTTTDVEIGIVVFGTVTWQNVQSQTTTAKTYDWHADNMGTPIATAEIDTTNGNDDISKVTWLYAAPTASIKEVSANEASIFPNPAATFVNFKFENAVSKLVVYDVTGKLVNTLTVTGNTLTLNTENFANGLYIYKALDKTGSESYAGKFNITK